MLSEKRLNLYQRSIGQHYAIAAPQIWGVDGSLDSLDVVKTADVVIASSDPLDVKAVGSRLFIDGKDMPLVNRQAELRDQYCKRPH